MISLDDEYSLVMPFEFLDKLRIVILIPAIIVWFGFTREAIEKDGLFSWGALLWSFLLSNAMRDFARFFSATLWSETNEGKAKGN